MAPVHEHSTSPTSATCFEQANSPAWDACDELASEDVASPDGVNLILDTLAETFHVEIPQTHYIDHVVRCVRGDATTGPSGSNCAENGGSHDGAVNRQSSGCACHHAGMPVPQVATQDTLLSERIHEQVVDHPDDQACRLSTDSVHRQGCRRACCGAAAGPSNPRPSPSQNEPRHQDSGLRERRDASDDETSVLPRSPRSPPPSAEEPWPTLKRDGHSVLACPTGSVRQARQMIEVNTERAKPFPSPFNVHSSMSMMLDARPCGTGAFVTMFVEGSAAQSGQVLLHVAGRDVLS